MKARYHKPISPNIVHNKKMKIVVLVDVNKGTVPCYWGSMYVQLVQFTTLLPSHTGKIENKNSIKSVQTYRLTLW